MRCIIHTRYYFHIFCMEQVLSGSTETTAGGARNFFLLGTATITLYASALALITLLFQYIDLLFPNDLAYWHDPYQGPARFAIATLVVVFPLYIYFTRRANNDLRAEPSRAGLSIRKWLLYITLFVAGFTVVVDLIVLINAFLGGEEMTAAFLLKVLAVLLVGGGAFWYYLKDLQGYWVSNEKTSKIIGIGVCIAVVAGVLGGFAVMGSPSTMREMRYDQERVYNLELIQSNIISFYQSKNRLPEDLNELTDPLSGFIVPSDPETNAPYTYQKTDALSFSLCAEFTHPSPETSQAEYAYMGDNWDHEAGGTCFSRTVDPERYPPFQKSAIAPQF